jgi:hypothetical protein
MTAQIQHKLINRYPLLNFDSCSIDAIFKSDSSNFANWPNPYRFKTVPLFNQPPKGAPTNNVEGYIMNFLLTKEGHLFLTGLEYPSYPNIAPQKANEQLTGTFTVLITISGLIPAYKIHFSNGVIDL